MIGVITMIKKQQGTRNKSPNANDKNTELRTQNNITTNIKL
jgi:hypothetical protein